MATEVAQQCSGGDFFNLNNSARPWFACYSGSRLQDYIISSGWNEPWGGHLGQRLVHAVFRPDC